MIDFKGSSTVAREVAEELTWLEKRLYAEVRKAGCWPDDDIARNLREVKCAYEWLEEVRDADENDTLEQA